VELFLLNKKPWRRRERGGDSPPTKKVNKSSNRGKSCGNEAFWETHVVGRKIETFLPSGRKEGVERRGQRTISGRGSAGWQVAKKRFYQRRLNDTSTKGKGVTR